MSSISSSLLDDIYEATFMPEKWYGVLDVISRAVGAEGALLCNVTNAALPWIATDGVKELYQSFFDDGWAYENSRTQALLTIPHTGFLSDADHLAEDWMATQPIYRDFLWPRGFGYASGTIIESPSDAVIGISIERKRTVGPFGQKELAYLDQLRPHLSRAALLSSHMEFMKIEAAMQALQLASVPAATVRKDGKVLQTNQLFHQYSKGIFVAAHDRLAFLNASAHAFYQTLLASDGSSGRTSRTFPLPATEDSPPALLHFVPIRGVAREIFLSAAFFLLVVPVRTGGTPGTDIVKGLFDLTPAEAQVATRLVQGQRITDIASTLGVSIETVRTQVKSVLAKSGMSGQRDFVSAVASLRLP